MPDNETPTDHPDLARWKDQYYSYTRLMSFRISSGADFSPACTDDEPIPEVIQVAKALGGIAHIMLLSGRSDEVRSQTLDWLDELSIPCTALYMREHGDHREDSVVKGEMIDDLRKQWPNEHIMGIFEDRKQVVDMYRAKGLRVFQVAEGNF